MKLEIQTLVKRRRLSCLSWKSIERKRRHFSDAQKATVVWRHLGDKVPVSDLRG